MDNGCCSLLDIEISNLRQLFPPICKGSGHFCLFIRGLAIFPLVVRGLAIFCLHPFLFLSLVLFGPLGWLTCWIPPVVFFALHYTYFTTLATHETSKGVLTAPLFHSEKIPLFPLSSLSTFSATQTNLSLLPSVLMKGLKHVKFLHNLLLF